MPQRTAWSGHSQLRSEHAKLWAIPRPHELELALDQNVSQNVSQIIELIIESTLGDLACGLNHLYILEGGQLGGDGVAHTASLWS